MNRRGFTKQMAVAVTGTLAASSVLTALLPKPIARLVNHDDHMWYREKSTDLRFWGTPGQYDGYPYSEVYERCEGEKALVYYRPNTFPDPSGRDYQREVIQGHVDAGNAEWL
jgi:hypothetical protein